MKVNTLKVDYAPFTQKQVDWLKQSLQKSSWLNVQEGGVRAGKNVISAIAYGASIDEHDDPFHLVAGYSLSTALINAVDSNGFGLLRYFENRCRLGEYNKKKALYVDTPKGQKVIIIAGGGKNGDEKAIRGASYGTAMITEANLCAETFLSEVRNRTIASSNEKIFHDFNPKDSRHWYYTNFLDEHIKKQREDSNYGLNYLHTTLVDNLSISQARVNEIVSRYDRTSLDYKRYILGQRVRAEGLVFPAFADSLSSKNKNYERWVKEVEASYSEILVGVDFAEHRYKNTFTACGLYRDGGNYKLHILEERNVEGGAHGVSVDDIAREHYNFYLELKSKYRLPTQSLCDHENTKILSMRQVHKANGSTHPIDSVDKMSIHNSEYPSQINGLLMTDKLTISKRCPNLIEALGNLVYSEKKIDEIKDENELINDYYDSFKYSIVKYLVKKNNYKLI